jgi:N-methylhydantoinase A
MAEELGIRRVLVPPHAGVLSAYGLLMADLRRDYVMTRVAPVTAERKDLLHPFVQLIRRGEKDAAGYPADSGRFVVECALDMRYEGQGYELTVPIAAELIPDAGAAEIRQCFEDSHRLRYGYAAPEKGIVIMSYRAAASLRGSGMAPELSGGPAGRSGPGELAPILVGGRELPARFHARGALPGGAGVDGPAVIEDLTTTIWVPPGWRAEVNAQQSIVMQLR